MEDQNAGKDGVGVDCVGQAGETGQAGSHEHQPVHVGSIGDDGGPETAQDKSDDQGGGIRVRSDALVAENSDIGDSLAAVGENPAAADAATSEERGSAPPSTLEAGACPVSKEDNTVDKSGGGPQADSAVPDHADDVRETVEDVGAVEVADGEGNALDREQETHTAHIGEVQNANVEIGRETKVDESASVPPELPAPGDPAGAEAPSLRDVGDEMDLDDIEQLPGISPGARAAVGEAAEGRWDGSFFLPSNFPAAGPDAAAHVLDMGAHGAWGAGHDWGTENAWGNSMLLDEQDPMVASAREWQDFDLATRQDNVAKAEEGTADDSVPRGALEKETNAKVSKAPAQEETLATRRTKRKVKVRNCFLKNVPVNPPATIRLHRP